MWSEPFPRGSAESKKSPPEDQFDSSTEGHGRCCHGRRSIEAGLGHPAIFINYTRESLRWVGFPPPKISEIRILFFLLQKSNESTYRPYYPVVCLVGDFFVFTMGFITMIHHHLGEYLWNFFPSIEESQILEDSMVFQA